MKRGQCVRPCSNPDCGIHTFGLNSIPDKAITIGEAAHICGAKLGSTRYDPLMSDMTRAAIINGLWLCRNCNEKIDRDEMRLNPTEKEHHSVKAPSIYSVGWLNS